MSDNLDKYIPEFDEYEARSKLVGLTRDQLVDMLIYSYKEKRVWAKSLGEESERLSRIRAIIEEPSRLLNMRGVPTSEELRRMIENGEG
jgi:hypothetical protein